jgi:hypothetical protein
MALLGWACGREDGYSTAGGMVSSPVVFEFLLSISLGLLAALFVELLRC